jgi:ABC-type glutathione transport system ATPase component
MADDPLLEVRGLRKTYTRRAGWRRTTAVEALVEVDLTVIRGSTLAVVGPSGSGKSTLARCLARLEDPTAGELWFEGKDLLALDRRESRETRRRIQLVFQDTATALNPRLNAAEIVSEPLAVRGEGGRRERRRRAQELMERVGLPPSWADRRPFELSGGQRQRLSLARALAVEARLLILDEALAGLDVSVQAQMLALLGELQAEHHLTYLHVSHDLPLMSAVADDVAVMSAGRVVERGPAARLFAAPRHPATAAMVEAVVALPETASPRP